MEPSYFLKNGVVLPVDQAVIPVSNIAYQYGYGVYETMKVRNGILYFVQEHINRFFYSAKCIDLEHELTPFKVKKSINDLLQECKVQSSNIKMLLVGGNRSTDAQFFIFLTSPLYPDRKLYKRGAKTITTQYERPFPKAKTLSMLPSYIAYRQAQQRDAYDCLLVNRDHHILEGTRTNLFVITGKTLITTPLSHVLDGVTRKTVIHVAKQSGFCVQESFINKNRIEECDGVFLTSTSTKIMPISQIDSLIIKEIPDNLKILMKVYDQFLDSCKGIL